MEMKKIKVGVWYDCGNFGYGKTTRVGGTHPPSVKVDIVHPFPRGVVSLQPRDIKRALDEHEVKAIESATTVV